MLVENNLVGVALFVPGGADQRRGGGSTTTWLLLLFASVVLLTYAAVEGARPACRGPCLRASPYYRSASRTTSLVALALALCLTWLD